MKNFRKKLLMAAACILAAAAVFCGCGRTAEMSTAEACAEKAESMNFDSYFADNLELVIEDDEFMIQKDAFDMDACLQNLSEDPDVSEDMLAYFSENLKVYMERDAVPDSTKGPSYFEIGEMTSVWEQDHTALVIWLHGEENRISILARKEYALDWPEPEPIDIDEIPFSPVGKQMQNLDIMDVDFWVGYSGPVISGAENVPLCTDDGFIPIDVIYYEDTQSYENKLCFVFAYEELETGKIAYSVVTYENVSVPGGFLSMSRTDPAHMYDSVEFGYSDDYLEELRPELWKYLHVDFTLWG